MLQERGQNIATQRMQGFDNVPSFLNAFALTDLA
jgi:hypothetical protein